MNISRAKRTTMTAIAIAGLALGTAAHASGGSGGGSASGGGGGGGATSTSCAPTSVVLYESTVAPPVANWWLANTTYVGTAQGKANKACDAVPGIVVRFQDVTNADDVCAVSIPQYNGLNYAKYGVKPPSNFRSFFSYSTGDHCVGTSRTIQATMSSSITGEIFGTTTTVFTP